MTATALTLLVTFGIFTSGQCQLPKGQIPTKVTAFVRHAADFAVNSFNNLSDIPQREVIIAIHNATEEAVIGILYRMDITLKSSTCKNLSTYNDATTKTCPPQPGAAPKYCHAEVLDDSSGSPRYTVKAYNCHY